MCRKAQANRYNNGLHCNILAQENVLRMYEMPNGIVIIRQ